MESGQLRKLNLCYAGIQSLYWAGFAAIWAFLSVLLLYRGFSNSQIGTFRRTRLNRPMAGSSRNAATASAEPIMLSLPPTLPTIWIM